MEQNGELQVPQSSQVSAGAWAFWLSVVLGVLLLACKAAHFDPPTSWTPADAGHLVQQTLIASASDAACCVCLGLICWPVLCLTARRPRWNSRVFYVILGLYLVLAFYGILSVRIFDYLRTPLTYRLLYLAGDAGNMQSSVMHYATPGVVAMLVAGPLAMVCLAAAGVRWCTPLARWKYSAPMLLVVLVAGWYAWARGAAAAEFGARDDRRITDNPHLALVASFITDWLRMGAVSFNESFTPEYAADFRVVAERGANAGRSTPGLNRGPKNVIVVIGESVGAQFINLYGSDFDTWPRLSAESANALVFDNYHTHIGNTANSLVSILLSVYPPPLDFREVAQERPRIKGTTAADVLKPLGYRTAFISAGDNEFSNQKALIAGRGFDAVWDHRDSGTQPRRDFSWGVEDRCMVDMILKFIDHNPGQPYCIYSWTQGAHHPYTPYPGQPTVDFKVDPAKWGNMTGDLGLYLNALREMDRQIGRLLDELRRRNLADSTIVIITGDHGEAFGWPHKGFGHTGKVVQEELHVPLVIWSPVRFHNAGRRQRVGGHVDLSPTVLDLLGVASPAPWQGTSLLSPSHPGRVYSYGAMSDNLLAIRDGNLKYTLNVNRNAEAMYDLQNDPMEQTDIAPRRPDDARRLRQRLAAWVSYQSKLEKTR